MIQKFVTGANVDIVFVVAGNTSTFNGATVVSVGGAYVEIIDSNSINRVYPWSQVYSVTVN